MCAAWSSFTLLTALHPTSSSSSLPPTTYTLDGLRVPSHLSCLLSPVSPDRIFRPAIAQVSKPSFALLPGLAVIACKVIRIALLSVSCAIRHDRCIHWQTDSVDSALQISQGGSSRISLR
jgi:hypothetical protein